MWVDGRGTFRTADHPEFDEVVHMSPRSDAILRLTPRPWIFDVLDDVEEEVFEHVERVGVDPAEEARFVDRLPPRVTLGVPGPVEGTADALSVQLRWQPVRWRVDYVWAVRDRIASSRRPVTRVQPHGRVLGLTGVPSPHLTLRRPEREAAPRD